LGAQKSRGLFTWTGIAQQIVAAVEHRPATALAVEAREWNGPVELVE